MKLEDGLRATIDYFAVRLFTRDMPRSGETQALPTDLRRASRKRRALLSTLDQPAC